MFQRCEDVDEFSQAMQELGSLVKVTAKSELVPALKLALWERGREKRGNPKEDQVR